MTIGINNLNSITHNITTLSILCNYAESHNLCWVSQLMLSLTTYAESHNLCWVSQLMLSLTLFIVMLKAVMLSVIMLNAIILLCWVTQRHFNGKESTVNKSLGGSTYPS
jgi:hypothetical protein